MMVFFGLAVLLPRLSVARLALAALAVSYAVEFSQLYQASWIQAVRAHPIGHLVLGSTFNWPDLAAYTVGAVLAVLLELCIWRAAAAASQIFRVNLLPQRQVVRAVM